MKNNIFIPKVINVGYQKRSDTYTGKLAYVIYYDEKNKLRKETSWQHWRDKEIPNEEFENIPISGFVLNKKVGDYSGDWGEHRQAYCRIYDPRNFEFEITIENLLYILENANSIKGKGLEGEFVYGWDGKDLLLMPVEAPDYKKITEYNNIVHNNESIKARDLIVGATYLTIGNQELIYMGKFDYYSDGYKWMQNGQYITSKKSDDIPMTSGKYGMTHISYERIDYLYGKYFWFAYKYYDYDYIDGERVYKDTYSWEFSQYRSIPRNKFISCIESKCSSDYADIYEQMICKNSFSPRDSEKDLYVPYTYEDFKKCVHNDDRFFSDSHFGYRVYYNNKTNLWTVQNDDYWNEVSGDKANDYYDRFNFTEVEENGYCSWSPKKIRKEMIPMTLEELYKKLCPCYKEVYLANGKLYERKYFYNGKE